MMIMNMIILPFPERRRAVRATSSKVHIESGHLPCHLLRHLSNSFRYFSLCCLLVIIIVFIQNELSELLYHTKLPCLTPNLLPA